MEEIYWQLIDLFHVVQGVVFWQPPRQALNKVKELVWEPSISCHGADEGIPELREALMQTENKMVNSSVMVTAGANQVFPGLLNICYSLPEAFRFRRRVKSQEEWKVFKLNFSRQHTKLCFNTVTAPSPLFFRNGT
ncbi:hypothetical protein NC651_008197 [Populus alba x Populus x berolinensis]|nr:hypothetical protein NC651_008197 [Populus alba x Populus x berolinensis]